VDAAKAAGADLKLIPPSVDYAFKIGAVAFLLAVLWTVLTSKEYPPDDLEEFNRGRRERRGLAAGFAEIASAIRDMPRTMKQLAAVQMFTWLGLFCMWMFFGLTTSYYIFGATDDNDPRFKDGQAWGGIAFAVYSIVCFAIAFVLPKLAELTSRKKVHSFSLVCGGVGLLSVYFIQDKWVLLATMVGVGIAWASILSMPYAILSGALPPARMGVYMGIFNFFIVIPEIIASLTFKPLVRYVFGNNPLYVVMLGGASLLVAALLVARVRDVADGDVPEREVIRADEEEPFSIQGSAQPVPSSGLVDKK
jgi:maltose/moltooligosaccharide transporter